MSPMSALVAVGGLQHVFLEFAVAFHIQQTEDHVQFIHKLMGGGAQGIHIAHHAVQSLQQLADLRFITEGTDGADHRTLAANGHCIADQQQTIAPQFAVVHWLAALQYGLQIVEQGAVNESLIRAGKEDLFRRGVDEIYLAMGIDRYHPPP